MLKAALKGALLLLALTTLTGWSTLSGLPCARVIKAEDGSILSVQYPPDGGLQVSVFSPHRETIGAKDDYGERDSSVEIKLRFRAQRNSVRLASATIVRMPDESAGILLDLEDRDSDLLKLFKRSNSVSIGFSDENAHYAHFNLTGSSKAIREVLACKGPNDQ